MKAYSSEDGQNSTRVMPKDKFDPEQIGIIDVAMRNIHATACFLEVSHLKVRTRLVYINLHVPGGYRGLEESVTAASTDNDSGNNILLESILAQ